MTQVELFEKIYRFINAGDKPSSRYVTKLQEEQAKEKNVDTKYLQKKLRIEIELDKAMDDLKDLVSNRDEEIESYTTELLAILTKIQKFLQSTEIAQSTAERINTSLQLVNRDFARIAHESVLQSEKVEKSIEANDSNDKVKKYPKSVFKPENAMKIPQAYLLNKSPVTLASLREEVYKAINQHKIFSINSYTPVLRAALRQRGWVEKVTLSYHYHLANKYKRLYFYEISQLLPLLNDPDCSQICQTMIKSRLLGFEKPDFYYGFSMAHTSKDLQHNTKKPFMNHLHCNTSAFSTKLGLNNFQNNMQFYEKHGSNIRLFKVLYPRSYFMNNPKESVLFSQDYNLTAAISLIKFVDEAIQKKNIIIISPSGTIPLDAFFFACHECNKYIKKLAPEAQLIDLPISAPTSWTNFLSWFYDITRLKDHFKEQKGETIQTIRSRVETIMNTIKWLRPSIEVDGTLNLWILKPEYGLRGRGLKIIRDLDTGKRICYNSRCRYIVQKYIERPLLIHDTKFDIRQWFLITDVKPLTLWIFKDCYIRFSSKKYNLNLLDPGTHICNNAVQQKYFGHEHDPELPKYRMWSATQFKKYLESIGRDDVFYKVIYPGMKKSLLSCVLLSPLYNNNRAKYFQLFGADFILDEQFRPWLLEINFCPSLEHSTPVTSVLCKEVVEDMVKVLVDRSSNEHASTGKFELFYKENNLKDYSKDEKWVSGVLDMTITPEVLKVDRKKKDMSLKKESRDTILQKLELDMDTIQQAVKRVTKKKIENLG